MKIPTELVKKIDAYIEHSDDGYTSRTDVVKTAVRDFFHKMRFNNQPPCGDGICDEEMKD